jgi:hypothetical protein
MKRSNERLKTDADYVFAIVRSYHSVLSRLKLSPDGLSILEVGPGPNFGPQLILASMGAKVVVTDRFLANFDRSGFSDTLKPLDFSSSSEKSIA